MTNSAGVLSWPCGTASTEGQGLPVRALDPFFGGSHRDFLVGLAAHSVHALDLHTLPGRHWAWRMHGGAAELALQARRSGTPRPAVIFAGSMLDLPLYRALAGAATAGVPTIVYFHENQLTYPLPEGAKRDLGYGWKNVMTALSADRVLFNSRYHHDEFFAAAEAFLARLPDCVPVGILDDIRAKAGVVHLGCDLRRFDEHRWEARGAPPLVLWNQRWEYDKAPEDVAEALMCLAGEGLEFRVALAGKNHGPVPPVLRRLREALAGRVVQFGYVSSAAEYARLLWQSDVVVSAARHEFFGQAVVEAVYCGCRPVLPRRLSYPEIIPQEVHPLVLYEEGRLVPALRAALQRGREWSEDWQRTWVARFDWGSIARKYDEEIWRLWERSPVSGG